PASDRRAVAESKAGSSPVPVERGGPISRLMAERTTQSWTSVPHFFVVRDVDAAALLEARVPLAPNVEKKARARLTHTDLLIALVARALARHPRMNVRWSAEGLRQNRELNIG